MSLNPEQFAAANQATVDSLLAIANAALASAERIANLNLTTTRSILENSATDAKSLIGAKSVPEAISIQATLAQPSIDKVAAYSRSVYEISSQTQQDLARMVEAQFESFQKTMGELVQKTSQSAPTGSDVAIAAVKSAIAAANSSFANMASMVRQMNELIEGGAPTVARGNQADGPKRPK